MKSFRPPVIPSSQITPESVYKERRKFMGASGLLLASALPGFGGVLDLFTSGGEPDDLKPTDYEQITTYNNFYEFGTGKSDPHRKSDAFKSRPWELKVDGLVAKPQTFGLEELKAIPAQERIYRLRCVEGWSMVIPWNGFMLADLLKKAEPLGNARYVRFETLYDPERLPMQGSFFAPIPFPYVEGLRLDEAMNPLTLLSTGIYGKELLAQNGAPIRLVVPWKYGFKSIKSIVKITLTEEEPLNTWQQVAPTEYGFYANVNPNVPHPRWSQARERIIGTFRKRDTEIFNGYGGQVASLYKGMDLTKHF